MKKTINIIIKIISVLLAFSLLTMLFMPKYIEKNTDGRNGNRNRRYVRAGIGMGNL